ncbi:MAG: TraB/GumN family protein [Spirochaetota bacterium]
MQPDSDTLTRYRLGDREILILGTAHISRESVEEVQQVLREEQPDRVCIEIDQSRYRALTDADRWKSLKITRAIREGKGFLLFANLVLASFQRRLGLDLGIKPGAEMVAAIQCARELDIPFSLCDREIQITLKRAWAKSGFWGKNKMLAVMLSSLFVREKLSEEDIERLKQKSALQSMLEELAGFLPRIKEVLIDERDRYLAAKIFGSEGRKVVAVIGAGHVPGVLEQLRLLERGEASPDVRDLELVPAKGLVLRALPWLIPVVIVGAIVAGLFIRGPEVTLTLTLRWFLINGTLSAVGAAVALGHPLTVVLAFVAAPFTSLVPVIGVGILTGVLEGTLRKPRVGDLENLHEDIATFKGFFRNRFTHVLIVFMLSNLGSTVGTFLGGIPLVASLFG